MKELSIESRSTLTGPLYGEDRWAAFAAADLFVLPSYTEGFSIALLEALACGVPALYTTRCNFPEAARRGAGLEVLPGFAGMTEGLRNLLCLSETERKAMGQRGTALVREKYSWSNVAKQTIEVYQWILGGGPPPSCVDVRPKRRG